MTSREITINDLIQRGYRETKAPFLPWFYQNTNGAITPDARVFEMGVYYVVVSPTATRHFTGNVDGQEINGRILNETDDLGNRLAA